MRRLGSGVGGIRVGVGGDGVGFGGVQVRGLGSGRSEELRGLGSKGLGEFGLRVGLGLGKSEGWGVESVGVRDWVREVGVRGVGGVRVGVLG